MKVSKQIINGLSTYALPLGGVILAYAFFREFIGAVQTAYGKSQEPVNKVKEQYDNYAQTLEGSTNLTLSEAQAEAICNNLVNAFSYTSTMSIGGTDEDSIFSLLDTDYTIEDREYIWATFGVRDYTMLGAGVTDFLGSFLSEPKDLGGWIASELSGSDYNQVQQYFNETIYKF